MWLLSTIAFVTDLRVVGGSAGHQLWQPDGADLAAFSEPTSDFRPFGSIGDIVRPAHLISSNEHSITISFESLAAARIFATAEMPSWSQLSSDSESGDEGGTGNTGKAALQNEVRTEVEMKLERSPSRSGSRSRSPRARGSASACDSELLEPVVATGPLLRSGVAWWAKPLHKAILNSRGAHILNHVPNKSMVHASGCSGMLTELLTVQVSTPRPIGWQ
jgi:hypothetical protein